MIGVDYILDKDKQQPENSQKLKQSVNKAIQKGSWFVWGASEADNEVASSEIANLNQSMIGDISSYKWYMELPENNCSDTCPFSYLLTLSHSLLNHQNATLVEYSIVFDNQLYIWVIPLQGKIQFRSVALPKDIQKLVKITRDSIGVRGRNNNNPLVKQDNPTNRLKQLHQLLINPIADLLPKDEQKRVIFIPHQEFFLVPFVALQDENHKYLIEKHTILTAPSIQALSLSQTNFQPAKKPNAPVLPRGESALIVGNPTMPKMPKGRVGKKLEPLEQLPGTEKEAKKVAQMLNTKPIIGD